MKFLKTYKVRNDLSDFANNTDENLEALDFAKNVILTQDDIFKQIGDFTGNYSKKNFSDYVLSAERRATLLFLLRHT